MNLSENFQKYKDWFKESEKDILIVLIITLTAFISFGLGRFSNLQDKKIPITIENMPATILETAGNSEAAFSSESVVSESGALVASKNGTKYYFPWGASAKKIKEENKIWFASSEEAKKAGYEPAANCKGL